MAAKTKVKKATKKAVPKRKKGLTDAVGKKPAWRRDLDILEQGLSPGKRVALSNTVARLAARLSSGDCPGCNGTGEIECETCDGEGSCVRCGADCEECYGEGHTECEECRGSGAMTPDDYDDTSYG